MAYNFTAEQDAMIMSRATTPWKVLAREMKMDIEARALANRRRYLIHNQHRARTPSQCVAYHDQIVALLQDGCTLSQIAAATGCSRAAVNRYIARHKLRS